MDIKYLPGIPPDNECGNQCSYFVYGTVVAVRYSIFDGISSIPEIKVVKLLECFVSEVCEIFQSNHSVKDVLVKLDLMNKNKK